jgi:hypothetical protein
MQNPYEQNFGDEDFLRVVYIRLIKKFNELKEIDTHKRRGKLPLPEMKKKQEIITDIYEVLRLLLSMIDYESDLGNVMSDRLNLIGNSILHEDYENSISLIQKLILNDH